MTACARSDQSSGFSRLRDGAGFAYRRVNGAALTDERHLARIKALAIPPAWTDVWTCPQANGYLQATGRDNRGRKQYRYHPDFRALREGAKFEHIRSCQELPGQDLLQYVDENGEIRAITSSDVNEYLRKISGMEISAKDFRTWAGTVLAAAAVRKVAARLGNTPTICRKCYTTRKS